MPDRGPIDQATALAALAALSLGCTPVQPLDLGRLVGGLYLGYDTDVEQLIPLRAGVGIVLAATLELDRPAGEAPIRDASARIQLADASARAPRLAPGLWVSDWRAAPDLYTQPGDLVGVMVTHEGDELGVAAWVPPILRLDLDLSTHPAGEDLVVALPPTWSEDYDHVLAELLDLTGEIAWSNHPDDLPGWLDRLATPPRPTQLVVPAERLQPGQPYALAVHFLRQLDQTALFAGPVNRPASTFVAGTAWLLPVGVTP